MEWNQVKPFNQAQGGTTPNLCLDNVRRGYGIANKYGSAWEAWQHTQQHPDRNVPAGLDVPLYYSYTATIDGVTANYGHINVRLANGTVWSDGNIYASIDAYLANHWPKFVGWGESINDVTIIQGATMQDSATEEDVNLLTVGMSDMQISANPNFANNVGRPLRDVQKEVFGYPTSVDFRLRAQAYDGLQKEITDLKAQLATQPANVKPYDGPALFVKQ